MWRALAVGVGVWFLLGLVLVVVDELRTWAHAQQRRADRGARLRFYSRGRSGIDVLRDALDKSHGATPGPVVSRRRRTNGEPRRGSVRNP
jgi:hypothetical protein